MTCHKVQTVRDDLLKRIFFHAAPPGDRGLGTPCTRAGQVQRLTHHHGCIRRDREEFRGICMKREGFTIIQNRKTYYITHFIYSFYFTSPMHDCSFTSLLHYHLVLSFHLLTPAPSSLTFLPPHFSPSSLTLLLTHPPSPHSPPPHSPSSSLTPSLTPLPPHSPPPHSPLSSLTTSSLTLLLTHSLPPQSPLSSPSSPTPSSHTPLLTHPSTPLFYVQCCVGNFQNMREKKSQIRNLNYYLTKIIIYAGM